MTRQDVVVIGGGQASLAIGYHLLLGMPWQHTRGSALLGWAKDDAQHIAAFEAAKSPAVPA